MKNNKIKKQVKKASYYSHEHGLIYLLDEKYHIIEKYHTRQVSLKQCGIIDEELELKSQSVVDREDLILNQKICPECGGKLVVERNRDALSGDKYTCENCGFRYESMPTG